MNRGHCQLAAVWLLVSCAAYAHEGHVHDDEAPDAVVVAAPVVQPALARTSRPARVIADARRTVVIAAPEAGTLEAPAGGFKRAGQSVRAGEVLGRLRPATPQAQRRDIEGRLVDARRDAMLGALQVDRYGITEAQHFDISLPTQTLQILSEYKAAKIRQSQLETSLEGVVEIRAPRAGQVLRADADASRQVAPGEALFAIQAQGNGLAVELKAVDEGFTAPLTAVAVLGDGRELALTRIGSGFDANQRAHVALYAPSAAAEGLVVNQRLRVQWPAVATP